jgi:tetratricopeptide (TPR) repeat protein
MESPEDLLSYLGFQVDIASVRQDTSPAANVIIQLQKFVEVTGSPELKGTAYYFLANAHDVSWQIRRRDPGYVPSWTDGELHSQKVALSEALRFREVLPKLRLLQLYTNLGNTLDRMGRCIEATYFYDKALELNPKFGMALGNKGISLYHYAQFVTNPYDRTILVREAHRILQMALGASLELGAKEGFSETKKQIESLAPSGLLNSKPVNHDAERKYRGKEHREYVRFCCKHRLFLNPLNQIGPALIARGDPLGLPPLLTEINDFSGYYFWSYFNSLKQEYTTACVLLFQSQRRKKNVHYADTDVFLINTLDYPCYSVDVEFLKLAFRTCYSLFDKIAFFLNAYFSLIIPDNKVYLRTIWYENYRTNRLQSKFVGMMNPGAMALFYLSQDLFEGKTTNERVDTYLRHIAAYRHALEHRFLKLHDAMYIPPTQQLDNPFDEFQFHLKDPKTSSIYLKDFLEDTVKLFRIARAAIIYLTMTVICNEDAKRPNIDESKILPGQILDTYKDNWKRY